MGFGIDTKNIQKPAAFSDEPLENGIHDVAVEKCEYVESSQGNLMLKLQYRTLKEGRFIFDQIMDDPTKQVNAYRLGRLLHALGIDISGEVELRDMTKIIKKGMKLRVAIITKEGSSFTNVDISTYEGYYPIEKTATAKLDTAPEEPQLEVAEEEAVEIAEVDDSY